VIEEKKAPKAAVTAAA